MSAPPHPKIRQVVANWYGIPGMPMMVLSREDEIVRYEMEHPEVPPQLWEYVDHEVRLVRMWARQDLGVDLVVFDEATQSYKMVQDLLFLEAYPDALQWKQAVLSLIKTNVRLWVVEHDV
jgi:hypothetical protein